VCVFTVCGVVYVGCGLWVVVCGLWFVFFVVGLSLLVVKLLACFHLECVCRRGVV
jgi:hypothetical protein